MRVDVERDAHRLEGELDALYVRLLARVPAAALAGVPLAGFPHLRLLRRTAHGEHYVYVHDAQRRCLAGCTVFNRLAGLDRALDAHVRSPHSRLRPAYQRLGLATAIYRDMLERGICLVSGARQSPGAHRLWRALARDYPLSYVRLHGRRIADAGRSIERRVFDDLDTRLLLCGAGWSAARLVGGGT